jgi:uncharacterized protein (TIGR02597 family)
LAAGQQDNYVGLARALDVRLADSGLESGFVDSVGLASFQRRDILLLFDNTKAAISKAPAKMLFRYNGTWHQAAAGNPVADNELLLAGSGFVVRKYKQAGSTSAIWANNPSY